MMIPPLLILLISWAIVAKPQPTSVSSSVPQSTACGDIIRRTNRSDENYARHFAASEVFACLSTVPFNPEVASRFIKYFNDTIQFHSTLAYLRNPPKGYQHPAVDLVHDLGVIQNNIDEGYYRNQYHFEEAVQRLIYSAHDKHLRLNAGILSVFHFYSPVSIVSLSPDGQQAPRIYLRTDVQASRNSADPWRPSPIQTINGQDAEEFFTRFAKTNSPGNLDPHADWNSLMYSPAQRIQYQSELFRSFVLYPGDSLSIVLDNGTSKNLRFHAVYVDPGPTGPLETGGDFYNFFVLGLYPAGFYQEVIKPLLDNLTKSEDQATTPTSQTTPAVSPTVSSTPLHDAWSDKNPAYPDPNLLQANVRDSKDALISGYFIEGTDLAVISIPSFKSYGYGVRAFGEAISVFISESLEKGKTRILIDLQRNGGGSTALAVDTFKRFFPDIDPYMGTRMRAHDMANDLGSLTDKWWNTKERLHEDGNDDDEDQRIASEWIFYLSSSEWLASNRIDAETGKTFTSWEEFYGPRELYGDNFTETQRYNYSDLEYVTDSLSHPEAGYIVYGYEGNPANGNKSFAAENITILTDGLCDSACALFVEMMRHEAGVKSVVAGGRPEPGPMQATGGTRGARGYSISILDIDINITQEIFAPRLNEKAASLPERISNIYTYSGGVNVRDAVRKGEDTPLQFLYDAADCRVYYTQETLFNQTALWLYAGEAMRHPESHCVANSTGHHRLNPPDPARSLPVGNDTSRYLDAKLKDSIIHLGDEGVQSSDKVPRRTTITGSHCFNDDDCKFPDKYACISLQPDCYRYICVPKCHLDSWCYSSMNLTGDCVGPYAPDDDFDNGISESDTPVYWGHCEPRSETYCDFDDLKTGSKKRSVSP